MPPAIAIVASVALPWLTGAALVLTCTHRAPFGRLLAIGYGYLVGALVVTLVLRGLSAAHVAWSLPVVAAPILVLGAAAAWLRRHTPWRGSWRGARATLADMPPFLRALFVLALALIVIRWVGLALEVAWRPVQPWDAWSHWGTKAKIWFEYRRMVPFVTPEAWLDSGAPMVFTDQRPTYPGTVPLLQVWTSLWLGSWNDAWMNAPWPALFLSLGVASYAQARRAGIDAVAAMLFTWLLLSLPFLDLHVALAGMADVFLATAFGLCVMAMAQAVRTRAVPDIALALVMAAGCASLKVEGSLWILTLLPAVLVAWRPRLGLRLVLLGATLAVAYLAFGPPKLRLFGYTLTTEFTNVSLPVLQHVFVMDNWHLFWYAAVAGVIWQRRRLLEPALAPLTIAMLGAIAFVLVVFFFSNAYGGVDDETLVNRFLLQIVPALAFYLLLLVRRAPSTAAVVTPAEHGVPAGHVVPAEPVTTAQPAAAPPQSAPIP